MYEFLLDNGMTREEYRFFLDSTLKKHCVMGNDDDFTNEHRVTGDGRTRASGEVFGYGQITWRCDDRDRLPIMHTETNLQEGPNGDEAVNWLSKEWSNVPCLRSFGIPMVGFTRCSLTDQIDWDTALREKNGRVNAVELYDLDRNIRAVGRSYKQLIADWCHMLQSLSLQLPIKTPREHDDLVARFRGTAGPS